MKASIFQYGLHGIDKPQPIKTIYYQDEESLISHLEEMQKDYQLDSSDTVVYEKFVTKRGDLVIKVSSESDWSYVAFPGTILKTITNKPIEKI